MANNIVVGGRTVRPAEVTRKGESIVARFTLATNNRRGKKKDEEASVTYVDCVAFGKQAEFAEKFLNDKGVSIVLNGRLRSDSFKDKEGEIVYTTNVVADGFEFASCDLNKVLLIGRLTKDPEVRYTKSAEPLAVARLTLAVDRKISKERKDAGDQSADFINVKLFGKTAEWAGKWTKKGQKIVVDGSYNKDVYDGKDGKKHSYIEVIGATANYAETKAEAEKRSGNTAEQPVAEPETVKPATASAPAEPVKTTASASKGAAEFTAVLDNENPFADESGATEETAFVPKGSESNPFDFGAMFGT